MSENGEYDAVVAGMIKPDSYPHPVEDVELVITAISAVFLAGDYAYKVKKPVKTAFLDYSTLEKRHHFCDLELSLNRRLSPDIYLDVVPVVREGGAVFVDAPGVPAEYAVKMKRLPSDGMMNVLLAHDRVDASVVRDVARVVAGFHAEAKTDASVSHYGTPGFLAGMLDDDLRQVEGLAGTVVSPQVSNRVGNFLRAFIEDNSGLLEERVRAGRVRDLHGDLHSRNICVPGPVYVFDCIEFNPAFRCSDVAKEISFLSMDLDFYDRVDLSRAYVAEYIRESGDRKAAELLDFYKAWLALIRGKINSVPADEDVSTSERKYSVLRARKYFALADGYSGGGRKPWLIVMMGAMGSGKSHLARLLSERFTVHVLDSDILRKRMAGISPDEPRLVGYGEDIYSAEMTDRVYARMTDAARELLSSGYSTLLDASFAKARHRKMARQAAVACGARFLLVECRAPLDVIRRRLEPDGSSGRGASDGRWELVGEQLDRMEPPNEFEGGELLVLDTDRPESELVEAVTTRMELLSRPNNQ